MLKRIFVLFLSLFLSGCFLEVGVASVAGTGLYLGYKHSQSGGLKSGFKNFWTESMSIGVLKQAKLNEPFLKVVSVNGIPVIIGAATSQSAIFKVKSLLHSKFENVESLANTNIGYWNKDLAISVAFKLMLDFYIATRNYEIYAIKNHVWIVGTAQSEYEKQVVLKKLETMNGVDSFSYYIVVAPSADEGYVLHEGS